jgi:hypothetical protein
VATPATTNAIHLTWTATGDDGSQGAAFLYDIRYSTEPITEDNFEEAPQAEKTPDPQEPGSMESYTLEGLEFSTKYYLAMKVRDRQFNFSPLSNPADATTPPPPEINIPEMEVVQKIFPGSIGSRNWQLNNEGGSDIYYRITKDTIGITKRARNLGWYADMDRGLDPATEAALMNAFNIPADGPGRDIGDILGTYDNATYANSGMAWVDSMLYMCDLQAGTLSVYDTAQQAIIQSYEIHGFPYGMVWDDEYLWIGDKFGNIFAYNLDGSAAGYSFSAPIEGSNALSWDGDYFLVNFILENDPKIYKVDETGDIIETYTSDLSNRSIWQSYWAPEHYTGNQWITNNNSIIAQMKLEEGHFTVVNEFTAPFNVSYALTHDHADLWYGKVGGTIYRIDDGMDELNWLIVSPDEATIPGESVKDINLTFDAREFDLGSYKANMVISSNDPENPLLRVPVDLQVTTTDGLGPDTSFCGHLNLTLDAGEGFAGYLWSDGATGQVHTIDSMDYGLGAATIWVDIMDIGGTTQRDSISVTFLDCTSIFEFASGLKVSVFPNPSRGIFTIKVDGLNDVLEISLADMSGKHILQEEMVSQNGSSQSMVVDVTSQPKGQYLLRLSAGKGIGVERVVVY